jgi:hypothetical protein
LREFDPVKEKRSLLNESILFWKGIGFRHEQEVRAVVLNAENHKYGWMPQQHGHFQTSLRESWMRFPS